MFEIIILGFRCIYCDENSVHFLFENRALIIGNLPNTGLLYLMCLEGATNAHYSYSLK